MTVKVINSGEDNEPGKVRILNRQPEIGIELVAELTDPDTPLKNVKWQWYRAVEASTGGVSQGQGVVCENRDPLRRRQPLRPSGISLTHKPPLLTQHGKRSQGQ